MSHNTSANIATADALTILLSNQHGIAAALEELAQWVASQGGDDAADNALAALNGLDTHARALTDAIYQLRQV
ncbi:hypothetical protein ABV589_22075 [Pseudomonas sp. HOU2]|uniref:hypothetical protein n=1 Tax=Pseudomonas sp. HOU2 TaxID=3230301 RepID=UPI003458DCF7